MRVLRMIVMSGLLIGAIACSEESEVPTPAQPAAGVSSSNEENPAPGVYSISRFEQDGVENPELKEQELRFNENGSVVLTLRNRELNGDWTYDASKGLLSVAVRGEDVEAALVSSPVWKTVSSSGEKVVLEAGEQETRKKMELTVKKLGDL